MCLSVMAAAQPKKLKELKASGFSLDAAAKLPSSLTPVVSNNSIDGLAGALGSLAI